MKKRISESKIGIGYLSNVISTCEQNGIECIVDDKNGDIYYYDPKGRKYGDDKLLHDNDVRIWDIVEDEELFDAILFDASGAIFKDFAVKWNELQKKGERDEVYKTKVCRPIIGKYTESHENSMDERVSDWDAKSFPDDELAGRIGKTITFQDVLDCIDYEADVYDLLETYDSTVRERVFKELSNRAGIEYGKLYRKWLKSSMYSESIHSDKYDVEIEFTRHHYGKKLKPGDKATIEVDLSEAPDCYDLDDLKDFVAKYASQQIPGGGVIEGYAFDILNEKDLVYILKGDEGWGEDVEFDFDKNTPDDIPDTLTEKEGMKYFEKMREAYHGHKLNYSKYREFSDKLFDAIVKGLLKTASIEELGKEWFKDYGTRNGWGWKTAFKYNVAAALHEIHKRKHPEEHKILPQKYHWRGWDEENCSCGLCSSSDSSD